MAIETWLAFALASAVLLASPGPTVLLVTSYALGHGWRAAVPTVIGVALGDLVAMTISVAGLGALLMASGELYLILKWIGAAYLIYLGVRLWRAGVPTGGDVHAVPMAARTMFSNAFTVTVLNPKALVFFVAFVPQFLDSGRPWLLQAAIMIATFVILAAINVFGYALLAVRARATIQRPSVQRMVNRIGGSALIGAGAVAALQSRP